ncbi:MAG: phosphotransferase [Ktedonobacteraceae bacterium]
MSMDKVTRILQQHFHIARWTITPPVDGQQKTCFVAQSGKQKVFVKFDVPLAPLLRLGEIGVAPRVLASGTEDDIPYVVQEYITGNYPDWRWFAEHLSTLATFIRHYHTDMQLAALLTSEESTNYAEHIALDIANLEAQFTSLESDVLHTPEITAAFAALKAQAKYLQPVALVPIHADPNSKNILLLADKMLMVDWDDIRLSDPMQDIGLLLWWYVARERWQDFFQNYGLPMNEQLTDRMFWWAARSSFAIALWHVAHHYDCASFLKDFVAAVRQESNPHAVFL